MVQGWYSLFVLRGFVMLRLLVIGLALFATGCSNSDGPSDTSKLVVAKSAVRDLLKDPSSAEFSGLKIGSYQGIELVCGFVNSSNSFGGKSGDQRFVTNGAEATVLEEQMEASEFATTWQQAGCS